MQVENFSSIQAPEWKLQALLHLSPAKSLAQDTLGTRSLLSSVEPQMEERRFRGSFGGDLMQSTDAGIGYMCPVSAAVSVVCVPYLAARENSQRGHLHHSAVLRRIAFFISTYDVRQRIKACEGFSSCRVCGACGRGRERANWPVSLPHRWEF